MEFFKHKPGELPALQAIANLFTWLEGFVAIIAAPLLIFGGMIAPLAIYTHSALTLDFPWVTAVYAAARAVGIDVWLLIAVGRILEATTWAGRSVWILTSLALSYVMVQANYLFLWENATGASEDQAIAHIGFSAEWWLLQSAVLAVVLIVLSRITREQRHKLALAAAPTPPAPIVVPPPDRPRGRPRTTTTASQTQTRSHAGMTLAQQRQRKEQRLRLVEGMLREAKREGRELSAGQVAERLNLRSKSTAADLLATARTRYQAV